MLNLSGKWDVILDPEDKGLHEKWFLKNFKEETLAEEIILPGSLNENRVGTPLDTTNFNNKDYVKRLRSNYDYIGAAWYQREVTLTDEMLSDFYELYLERVIFQSDVWINQSHMGTRDSLSTPHKFRVPKDKIDQKQFLLTIRIDNRDIKKIGEYPSAYTEETQTIWNGIVGKLHLSKSQSVEIDNVKITTNIHSKSVDLDVILTNNNFKNASVEYSITDLETSEKVVSGTTGLNGKININQDIKLWSEHKANLYNIDISIFNNDQLIDKTNKNFGFREISKEGNRLLVNGKPTFLRGTLECCIFPLTGYPPTDKNYWEKIFTTLKQYGLNHLRFHSWCPPEIAFDVADETGIYLQVEGPVWMDTWCGTEVGMHIEHYTYLKSEAKRIIETYGNHPSFCFFSNGNEINGDFNLLHDIIEYINSDKRFLYTLTTNWDRKIDSADNLFIAQTVDGKGIRGQYFPNEILIGTTIEYTQAITQRDVPVISHEVGQFSVYPDMSEIESYTGALNPVNFKWIRDDPESKDMLNMSQKFTYASGKLAANLYKDEIEAALRTQNFGGIQLLDLHDFPGQSTATVGILNSFWDSKGLIKPEEFNGFCNSIVPLALMKKRVWKNSEDLDFTVRIANYSGSDIQSETVLCTLNDGDEVIYKNSYSLEKPVGQGELKDLLEISIQLNSITQASNLTLQLELLSSNVKNSWPLWVFPTPQEITSSNLLVSETISNEAIAALENGENVLFLPKQQDITRAVPGKYFPVFWSPVHFVTKDPCGMFINKEHSLFENFPTDDFGNYQWKSLFDNSFSVDYSEFKNGFKPIIDIVPNFFNNCLRTPLFEGRVGKGKFIFCSFNLSSQKLNTEQSALLNAIKSYMVKDSFDPKNSFSKEELLSLLIKEDEAAIQQLSGTNLAMGKDVTSDGQLNSEHCASSGNDGIGHTYWAAEDYKTGHWWQVDLGEVQNIKGTRVTFTKEANYLYVIQVSTDGETWKVGVNQTGQTAKDKVRIDMFSEEARYVRIVYNGLPEGVRAEHHNFEVY